MGRRVFARYRGTVVDPITVGPIVGMRDSVDPTTGDPRLARRLLNCYPLDPDIQGRVVGVPGFTQTGVGGGAQGGSAGVRTGQLIYQFTELDGTEHAIRIVGGKVYELDWSTDTWTEVLTAAQLSAASITLSTTARCYATTLNDQMIVTDGVNTPWAWDGTAGGGLTSLTNAPVAFGPPAVYYGKLFFIKSTERSAFVWSEENQPNTGYEAGGYNNAWTLGQTDANALFRLLGTNEALYVFRADSITAVSGAVTPQFQSSGTREGVSDTVGTTSPDSVFFHRSAIFFVDRRCRPHFFEPGGKPVPIWADFRVTVSSHDPAQVENVQGFYDPSTELQRIAFAEVLASAESAQMAYHRKLGAPMACGVFSGYEAHRFGVVKDGDGQARVMHLSADGYAYVHGTPSGTSWDYGFNSGSEAIAHEFASPYLGQDERLEQAFDRLDASLSASSDLTAASVSYTTPSGTSAAQTFSETGGGMLWDVGLWDEGDWGGAASKHLAVGWKALGRWLSFSIRHQQLGEQFGIISAEVQRRVVGPYAETP